MLCCDSDAGSITQAPMTPTAPKGPHGTLTRRPAELPIVIPVENKSYSGAAGAGSKMGIHVTRAGVGTIRLYEGESQMAQFTAYTLDNAATASKLILEDVRKAFGFIPNLQANMAESPELLAAYSRLWDLFSRSSLSPTEQQVVYMTTSLENECHYCMAGHTQLAKMQKIDGAIIQALRNGRPIPDAKLEALHAFVTKVVRQRGFVTDKDVAAFLAAGYTKRNVLEVVLGVGTKVLSNYTNHIVHTELDAFMKGAEWSKPAAGAA
jgi:AhpD family alkylhydroperoxidase